ncbi:hypothetical protein HHI36_015002 [Cryptolaemus montrouzieri]|uniref:Uncharacterized protein n=1 Tax=Cryptolaemus montrouzieri TaxID=559131 RepID=A0ABD2N4B5_9CUCU
MRKLPFLDLHSQAILHVVSAAASIEGATSTCFGILFQPLALRRQVADLPMFYRYLHRRCSKELFWENSCFAATLGWAGDLWISLTSSIFLTFYNLALFQKRVNRHLNSS